MQPWLGEPRAALAEVVVREALSLERGAHVRHGLDVLDATDAPTTETLTFESGTVTWGYRAPNGAFGQSDELAAVRRRGSLLIPAGQAVNLNARRLRLWSEFLMLDGSWARFWLGVFLTVNPGAISADANGRTTQTLTLADKTHLWANTLLVEPVHVPAGTAIIAWVKNRMTTRFGETRFAIASSDALLDEARTFEPGLSELEVCSRMLTAAGFDGLITDETGAAASQPLANLAGKGPEITYGAGQGKVITAGEVAPLLPSLPNVVRFSARQGPSLGNVEGNGLATRRNQSTGPASIDERGGVEVEIHVDVDADSQTVLEQIADAEAGRYFAGGGQSWSGSVALNPRHSDRDVIALDLPHLGLSDVAFEVTSWTYPLQPITSEQGVLMAVTAERRVAL